MARRTLDFQVRTPDELAWHAEALSIRVPTETGQVGLRPGVEPVVLAVEAGIVLAKTRTGTTFVGTAGGLLRADGAAVSLLTPLAIVRDDIGSLVDDLERRLGEPSSEMQARASLGKLEDRILEELHRQPEEFRPVRSRNR